METIAALLYYGGDLFSMVTCSHLSLPIHASQVFCLERRNRVSSAVVAFHRRRRNPAAYTNPESSTHRRHQGGRFIRVTPNLGVWRGGYECEWLCEWQAVVVILILLDDIVGVVVAAVDLRSSTRWLVDVRVFVGARSRRTFHHGVRCWRSSGAWLDATSRELGGCSQVPCSWMPCVADCCSHHPRVCGGV